MFDKKMKNKEELINASLKLENQMEDKNSKMNNINRIFANVDVFLIPALQEYLKALLNLSNILLKFHR